ncbi:NRDE family protein [Bacillus alkalicellulosilyticus]|uniref:NRDE family protein n=1 Tax=Alkalihalobacterium alkalicellulosilyticum TaxID=1912214 RepID=UPI000997FA4A|nr:NRDE family protein [Bacillus alkalicellulosilyticus]
MCLINFSFERHPTYQLVVAANRDEFYDRATAPAAYWNDAPHILAGKDLVSHGTWLGVTKKGRFAALTNYRDQVTIENPKSRGKLVSNFLNSSFSAKEYGILIEETKTQYQGFNLLLWDGREFFYHSNRSEKFQKLIPGTYSFSNALLHSDWPKVRKGKTLLETCNEKTGDDLFECLLGGLSDHVVAEDHLLPDTGVGIEMERWLSSMFINKGNYGTRSSTIITFDYEGKVHFFERTYNFYGKKKNDVDYTLRIHNKKRGI